VTIENEKEVKRETKITIKAKNNNQKQPPYHKKGKRKS
jgi:hypothetical protein